MTVLPVKPPYLSECNGCGVCCIAEQCEVSVREFGQAQLCPALEFDQGRFWCGLMIDPDYYGAYVPPELKSVHPKAGALLYRYVISSDSGCDSEGEDWL